MKQQLLLLDDVDGLGKKGELVSARTGYIRNFLLPKRLATIASPNTLRKQEKLRKERAEQAIVHRRESEELAQQIGAINLETKVKVDPEGHMYGSVSAADIAQLFVERGLPIEKKNVALTKPIKQTGAHKIVIKLKEEISVTCTLNIIAEGLVQTGIENVVKPILPDQQEAEKAPE
ncbi:MAG TPA: 50S ribosomal protein L9 [Chlamydiales bacterium]